MTICEHLIAGVKRIDIICDKGKITFEYCGICGYLVNIFPSRELYIANFPDRNPDAAEGEGCNHEKIVNGEPIVLWKKQLCVCDRGNLEIVYCGNCGQYEYSGESKELYLANYLEYAEVKELQRLREEHAKTTGTTY